MQQQQTLNEEAIFQVARHIQPPEALAAYLDQACGADESLHARVLALLGSPGDADQFLEAPPSIFQIDFAATMDQTLIEKPGTQIGPYKLLQQIGEGGMGAVYMAEQKEPIRRTVALKIIKPGMDSQQVVARFEAERQALAMMNHPNIAKVLDAGATESGRPYFVMELVKGIPITEYCDTHKLTTRQRLELLVTICDAVQHAHQKGIIHRDLKPGNLLVELHDVRPVPKVVDFGIAKSTNQRLTEHTLCTNFSQMIGTPLYMSPEQAQLSGLDVDTRSDVYSLGVLLYELITGTTPFTKDAMSKIGYDEMRRKIQYDDPPRPSERISTLNAEALSTLTANQRVDTRKLQQQVHNELDWVVMKALDKDRTRRYQTATAFAEDIQRYLNDEPVQACPPSLSYRLQKISRRNKGLLITGALVAASLCAGLLGTTWQAILATRAEAVAREQERTAMASADSERQARESESDQRRKAEIAEVEARQHERAAKDQLAISNAVTDFLQKDLLGQAGSYTQADGEFTPDPDLTIRKALDRASASVGDRFKDRPELEAAIRCTMGNSYKQIGQFNQAIDQFERSAEIRTGTLGPEDHITLETLIDLAHSYRNAGRSSDAIKLYGKICNARLKVLGPEHADTLATRAALAYAFQCVQKTSEAIDLFEQVRDSQVTLLGPEHKDTLRTLNNLSLAYLDADRSSDAIKLLEQVTNVYTKLDRDDNPNSLNSLSNLALAYKLAGRRNEAIAIVEKVRDSKVKIFGPEHPDTLLTLVSLAESYNDIGKTTEAILMYEQASDAQIKILGPTHLHTLVTLSLLADSYRTIGKTSEAILIHRQVHDARVRILGPEHPSSLMALHNLAFDYQSAGNTSQAIEILGHVRDVSARILGSEHRLTLMTLNNLAVLYKSSGKSSEAIELYKQVCDARLRLLGPEHRDTLHTLNCLALEYKLAGKSSEAILIYGQVCDANVKTLGPEHSTSLLTLQNLACAYRDAGRISEAIALFEQVREAQIKTLGLEHRLTLITIANLGIAYIQVDRVKEAILLLEEAYPVSRKIRGADSIADQLLYAYSKADKSDEIAKLIPELLASARTELPKDGKQIASVLSSCGRGFLALKAWTDAEPLLRECLSIREKLEADDWRTFNTFSMLGGSLLGQEKFAEAEPLLAVGYEGMRLREDKIPSYARIRLTESIERLVELYTAWQKPEQAEEWRTSLDQQPR